MKKLLVIAALFLASFSAEAQSGCGNMLFPTIDSLQNFINRYIRNSAINSFTELRLNTALIGMKQWVDCLKRNGLDSLAMVDGGGSNPDTLKVFVNGSFAYNLLVTGGGGGTSGDSLRYVVRTGFDSLVKVESATMWAVKGLSQNLGGQGIVDTRVVTDTTIAHTLQIGNNDASTTGQLTETRYVPLNSNILRFFGGQVQFQSNTTLPAVQYRNTGGAFGIAMEHDATSIGGSAWHNFRIVNEFATPNYITRLGYNINGQGARVDATKASTVIQFEREFEISGYGFSSEFIVANTNDAGNTARFIYYIRSRANRKSSVTFQVSDFNVKDDSLNLEYLSVNANGRMNLFAATTGELPAYGAANRAGSANPTVLYQWNAAGSDYVPLIGAATDTTTFIGAATKFAMAGNYTTEGSQIKGYYLGAANGKRGGLLADHDIGWIKLYSYNNTWPILVEVEGTEHIRINNTDGIKFSQLTGTGTRVPMLSNTGVLSALANGTDGQVLKLVSGAPAWAADATGGGGGTGWEITGNTLAATGILGTLSNHSMQIRTNDVERGAWTNDGKFLINVPLGTQDATSNFQLDGNIQVGGTALSQFAMDLNNTVASSANDQTLYALRVRPGYSTAHTGTSYNIGDFTASAPSDLVFRVFNTHASNDAVFQVVGANGQINLYSASGIYTPGIDMQLSAGASSNINFNRGFLSTVAFMDASGFKYSADYSASYTDRSLVDRGWANATKANIASPTFTGLVTTPLIKITSGSPGAGKVLTSDADGDATWETVGYSEGTHTSTLTNGTNVSSSTASSGQYMRVGNKVTYSFRVEVTTTGAGATELGLSLPVASDFSANGDAAAAATSTTSHLSGVVIADGTNDRLSLQFTSTGAGTYTFYCTILYRIVLP